MRVLVKGAEGVTSSELPVPCILLLSFGYECAAEGISFLSQPLLALNNASCLVLECVFTFASGTVFMTSVKPSGHRRLTLNLAGVLGH